MFELISRFNQGNGRAVSADPVAKAWADLALPALGWAGVSFAPPADVVETKDAIVVRVDLPGYKSDEIALKVENDVLAIEAERKATAEVAGETYHRTERLFGKVARSFALPIGVDTARTDARYVDGVLEITLPKREEAKPRTISVKVGK
jgi:HSP20 family protein